MQFNKKGEVTSDKKVLLEMDFTLGNNYQQTPTTHCFVCGSEELLFYAKNMFTKFNTKTKESIIISEPIVSPACI